MDSLKKISFIFRVISFVSAFECVENQFQAKISSKCQEIELSLGLTRFDSPLTKQFAVKE